MLRIRYSHTNGSDALAFSVERMSDGLLYDFGTSAFTAGTPGQPTSPLTVRGGLYPFLYTAVLTNPSQSQFTDGQYAVHLHGPDGNAFAFGYATLWQQDDQPVNPRTTWAFGVDGYRADQVLALLLAGTGGNEDDSVDGVAAMHSPGGTPRITATFTSTGVQKTLNPPA